MPELRDKADGREVQEREVQGREDVGRDYDEPERRLIDIGDNRVVEPDNQEPQPAHSRGRTVFNADTVRQGPPGERVYNVLAVSLTAAFLLCLGVYVLWRLTS